MVFLIYYVIDYRCVMNYLKQITLSSTTNTAGSKTSWNHWNCHQTAKNVEMRFQAVIGNHNLFT